MRTAIHLVRLNVKTRLRAMKPGVWALVALAAVLLPALSIMLGRALAGLPVSPHDMLLFINGFLNVLLFMQLGSAFSAAFSNLYVSRDLFLLLASPCRPRWIILAKMLEIFASGLIPYLVFGAPLFFGIGMGLHAPVWYYPLVLLAGIPFVALPAVVAVMANMLVSRLVPAYRAKEISGALGVIVGSVIYLVTRLATFASRKIGSLSDFAGSLARIGVSWSPSVVLARAAVEGLDGRLFPLAMVALGMAGIAVILFSLITQGAERAYVSGWAAAGARRRGRGLVREVRPSASSGAGRFAIELHSLKVEARLFFRDLESQSQAIYAMVMTLGMVLLRPGDAGATGSTMDSLIPFVYLVVGGGYSKWGLNSMLVTARLLRQAPAHSVKVMRGKAFFYGAIQTVFVAVLAFIMTLFGRPVLGNKFILGIVWASVAFTTGAVSVAATVYDPGVSETTGIPRLGTAGNIVLLVSNLTISFIAGAGYLWGMSKGELWKCALLIVAVMAGVFAIAVNAAARMVLSAKP